MGNTFNLKEKKIERYKQKQIINEKSKRNLKKHNSKLKEKGNLPVCFVSHFQAHLTI